MNKLAIIIENDQDSANLFSHVLDFVGFETKVFMSGNHALQYLHENTPILILLDLQLSQTISGKDILEYIHKIPRLSATHIIVITGYPHLAQKIEDLADLVLIKPVSMPQLSALVSRICNDQISEIFFRHASYNAQTGLPNRALLKNRLRKAIERGKREKDFQFGLVVIQLTSLEIDKLLDKTPTENHYLASFIKRLKRHLRGVDSLASFGNDRFAVLFENISSPDDVSIIAERLQTELDLPYEINDEETSISADIRIIPSVHEYQNVDEILEIADQCFEGEPF